MPSEEYFRALQATREKHKGKKVFSGRFLARYLPDIEKIIADHGVRTVLDYGCGRAVHWRDGSLAKRLGVKVTLYDPGVEGLDKEPQGEFDLVICTQVLGSIPIADLPWALNRLCVFATEAVYIGERLGKVRKRIHKDMARDGLMPHGWTREQWLEAVRDAPRLGPPIYLRTKDKERGETHLDVIA